MIGRMLIALCALVLLNGCLLANYDAQPAPVVIDNRPPCPAVSEYTKAEQDELYIRLYGLPTNDIVRRALVRYFRMRKQCSVKVGQ